jgi:hypothetical protein
MMHFHSKVKAATLCPTQFLRTTRVSMAAEAKPGQARKGKTYTRALRLKEKSVLSMADTSLTKSESAWRSRS